MERWELEAREAIRSIIGRYAHCADRGHFAELVSLFTEDGALAIAGRDPLVGRDAIRSFLTATKSTLAVQSARPFIRHHVSSILIDVAARNTATAASYFFVITERGPDHWGRYRDELARTADGWLFRRRTVRLDGRREP
jgi:hypothetical protein